MLRVAKVNAINISLGPKKYGITPQFSEQMLGDLCGGGEGGNGGDP